MRRQNNNNNNNNKTWKEEERKTTGINLSKIQDLTKERRNVTLDYNEHIANPVKCI
jgi:hypothetical protein